MGSLEAPPQTSQPKETNSKVYQVPMGSLESPPQSGQPKGSDSKVSSVPRWSLEAPPQRGEAETSCSFFHHQNEAKHKVWTKGV